MMDAMPMDAMPMDALAVEAEDRLGIALTADQIAAFAAYAQALVIWNERMNLTAITDPEGVRVRHFLDSLYAVRAFDPAAAPRLIDVGTGAGFPGLPLRIAYPQIKLTLLEATGKKLTFLQHICDLLGLTDVATVHARAEDAGQDAAHRAAYDIAVARAVARLPILLEYLLPLVSVGGCCIAMKGVTAHAEAADSSRALATLGGVLRTIEPIDLPGVEAPHYLVIIDKIAPTPTIYPRRAGLPTQTPL